MAAAEQKLVAADRRHIRTGASARVTETTRVLVAPTTVGHLASASVIGVKLYNVHGQRTLRHATSEVELRPGSALVCSASSTPMRIVKALEAPITSQRTTPRAAVGATRRAASAPRVGEMQIQRPSDMQMQRVVSTPVVLPTRPVSAVEPRGALIRTASAPSFTPTPRSLPSTPIRASTVATTPAPQDSPYGFLGHLAAAANALGPTSVGQPGLRLPDTKRPSDRLQLAEPSLHRVGASLVVPRGNWPLRQESTSQTASSAVRVSVENPL